MLKWSISLTASLYILQCNFSPYECCFSFQNNDSTQICQTATAHHSSWATSEWSLWYHRIHHNSSYGLNNEKKMKHCTNWSKETEKNNSAVGRRNSNQFQSQFSRNTAVFIFHRSPWGSLMWNTQWLFIFWNIFFFLLYYYFFSMLMVSRMHEA